MEVLQVYLRILNVILAIDAGFTLDRMRREDEADMKMLAFQKSISANQIAMYQTVESHSLLSAPTATFYVEYW